MANNNAEENKYKKYDYKNIESSKLLDIN